MEGSVEPSKRDKVLCGDERRSITPSRVSGNISLGGGARPRGFRRPRSIDRPARASAVSSTIHDLLRCAHWGRAAIDSAPALPAGWAVAHKAGTTGKRVRGFSSTAPLVEAAAAE